MAVNLRHCDQRQLITCNVFVDLGELLSFNEFVHTNNDYRCVDQGVEHILATLDRSTHRQRSDNPVIRCGLITPASQSNEECS